MYSSQKAKSTLVIIFFVLLLMVLYINQFILPAPLYTISNHDDYPHNVTVRITGYNGEYFEETTYYLSPGSSVTSRKPQWLLLKWYNPFEEGYMGFASGNYEYYIESENISESYNMTPHKFNTVVFDLTNESGVFDIVVEEITV